MKNLLFLLLFWSTGASFAQIDTNWIWYQQSDTFFKHLDLSAVPDDILIEHGFPLIDFNNFRGDTNDWKADVDQFGLAYFALSTATLDSTVRLPDPSGYMQITDTIDYSDAIPLLCLHQKYGAIDSSSLANQLFDTLNGMLYDHPGRTQSPYVEEEMFLITPALMETRGSALKMVYRPGLFYDNTGLTVSQVEINYGDIRGWIPLPANVPIAAIYDSAGVYEIQYRVTYSDSSVKSGRVDFDYDKPKALTGPYSDHDSIPLSGGYVHYSLACGHTGITKPFIWVEGYNPKVGSIDLRISYEKIFERLQYASSTTNFLQMKDWLQQNSYDLIVLDFPDQDLSLEDFSGFVVDCLEWINAEKHANHSSEKNVMLGQSMGGMCARYALRLMETTGADHETSQYISFDSGHLGVNIPMAMQMAVRHFSGIKTSWGSHLRDHVSFIRDAERLLELVSSRQMLQYYDSTAFDGEHWFYSGKPSLHDNFFTKLNDPAFLGPPQNCEFIAMANGYLGGGDATQQFSNGEQFLWISNNNLLGIIEGYSGKFLRIVAKKFLVFNMSMLAPNHESYAHMLYYCQAKFRLFGVVPIFESTVSRTDGANWEGLDSAPGGFFMEEPLNYLLYTGGTPVNTFKLRTFCFTPVSSTLNYHNVSTNYPTIKDPYKDFSAISTQLASGNHPGVDSYCGMTNFTHYSNINDDILNTAHTYFNATNAPFLLNHITGTDAFAAITTLTNPFNFGRLTIDPSVDYVTSGPRSTGSLIDHSVTVNSGGVIGVNDYQRIGLNPNSSTSSTTTDPNGFFLVEVKNACDDDDQIIVDLNGTAAMKIGDNNGRKGEVDVYGNHKVTVGSGSKVEIFPGSRMVLKNGSTLVIEGNGQLLLHDDAALFIEPGATLRYEDNAKIVTEGSNNVIWVEGRIQLGTNADFNIDHSASWTSGAIVFNSNEEAFTGDGNNTVTLQGDGDSDDFVFVHEGSTLKVFDTHISRFEIADARVNLEQDCEMRIQQPLWIFTSDVQSTDQNFGITATDVIRIGSCDFRNTQLNALLDIENTGTLTISSSTFADDGSIENQYGYQVYVSGMSYSISTSDFRPFAYGHVGIYSENLTAPSTISKSTFSDYAPEDTPVTIGVFDYSDEDVSLYQCTFSTLATGIDKYGGNLSLKCCEFDQNAGTNVIADHGCTLIMQTNDGSGYNIFYVTSSGYNIRLDGGHIEIFKGYNYIDASGSLPCISGSDMYTCMGTGCLVDFSYNQWNSSNTAPGSSDFSLISANAHAITVAASTVASLPRCGAYDPSGGGEEDPENPDGKSLATSPYVAIWSETLGDSIPADALYRQALWSTTLLDSSGNDLQAINLFYDIVTAGLDPTDSLNNYLLWKTADGIKQALESAYRDSVLSRADNSAQFDSFCGKYNAALRMLTDSRIDSLNLGKQFRNEINKMHLMRVIGHSDVALDILTHLETCGLDSMQQVLVNHWKTQLSNDLVRFETGLEWLDTIVTADTSGYNVPTDNGIIPNFGALITDPLTIIYPVCEQSQEISTPESSDDLILFPNPARTKIGVSAENSLNRIVAVSIVSLEGRVLLEKEVVADEQNPIFDLSHAARGTYICLVKRSDGSLQQKHFVLQ